jgi:RHS repeat-associated protein
VLTSTDGAGNTTQYAYTAANLVWCKVAPAEYLAGVRCPTTEPASPPAPGAADPELGVSLTFYNAADQITASTDPLGNTTEYQYTSGVTGVPNGLTYCTLDPVAYSAGAVCAPYGATPTPGTSTKTFDAAGDVLTSTDADGHTTTNCYYSASSGCAAAAPAGGDGGNPTLLYSTTDPDGTTTTYTYNPAGQVLEQTQSFHGSVATTLNAYDALGHKFCTVAPAEVAKGVTCPASPPATPPTPSLSPNASTDPYLGATIDTFDALGQIIQTTSPIGGVTLTAFDQAGDQVCSVGPMAAAKGVRCGATVPVAPATLTCTSTPLSDPDPGATVSFYNSLGEVAQVTNPLGGATLSTYDANGNTICQTVTSNDATNAPSVTTTTTYDADNRVIQTTVAPDTSVAATSMSAYDPDGNVYCSVSPSAVVAGAASSTDTGGYQCPSWNASWITAPPNPSTLYSATPTSAQAHDVTTTFFDANGNQVQQTSATDGTTVTTYDADSRSVCSMAPADFTTWATANPAAPYPYACPSSAPQVAPTGATGVTTTLYDPAGHAVSSTDPVGNTTTTTYGPDGETLVVSAPGNQVTTNCYYWQVATCAASAPPGGGAANALFSTTQPSPGGGVAGQLTTHTYLPGGATNVTTTASGSTTDSYDQAGNLTGEANSPSAGYTQTPNVTYSYWPDGSKESMTDGNGTTTYAYDDMGNLTEKRFAPGSGSSVAASTTTQSYFTNGDVATIGYPATASVANPTVTHAYDAAGQLASVTDWLGHTTTIAYDPNGNVSNTAYPNGTQVSATHDLSGGTTSITATPTATPASPLVGFTYQRNSADQVTGQSATGAATGSSTYTYDPNQRLGSVNGTSAAYDPASNPVTLATGATQTFNGQGQVTSSTIAGATTAYTYNSAGDRTVAQPASAPGTRYSYNQDNQLTSSSTPKSVAGMSIAAGYDHTVALAADGTVSTWGNNGSGQLGNGTTTSSSTPVGVTGLANVVAVAAGFETSAALESNGTVWTWGNNAHGQLGNGTTTNSDVPVQVSGLSGVTSISAGGFSMMAVTSSGTVWSWGDNSQGQLGNGTTTSSDVPVQVTGLSGVTAVSAGFWYFSSALESNGTVWTWGYNAYGQLGNGTTTSSDVPVQVTGLPSVKAVSSGGLHSLALGTNGTVWAWGTNTDGQLGNGTTATALSPVQVPGVTATSISAGFGTSLATQMSGTVLAWGNNSKGQLGNGTTTNSATPVPMENVTNARSVAAGGFHSVVLGSNGTIVATGGDGSGQLGDGSTTNVDVPTSVTAWNPDGTTTPTNSYTYAFTYNGNGLRVGESSAAGTQTFVWNTTTSTPEILSDGNNSYIYGSGGRVLEQIDASGTPTYFVQGQLGSTRALTNASGAVVATYTYNAYGAVTSHTGTVTTPIGFTGGYTDPNGLIYLVHRYYDPTTGQFLSVDPLVAQTQQAYIYAGDDPVNGSDPLGLMCWGLCTFTNAAKSVGHFVAKHKAAITEVAAGVAVVAVVVVATVATGGIVDAVAIGAAGASEETAAGVAGPEFVGLWGVTYPLDVTIALAPLWGLGLGGLGLAGYGVASLLGGGSRNTKNTSACPA